MQKKKNVALLVSLLILVSITVILFLSDRDGATLDVDKDIFRPEEITSIDSVVLDSRRGRVVVSFDGVRWKINNQYNADRDMIDVLFATLQQAEVRRPVAAKIRDSVASQLVNDGTRVLLYQSDALAMSFIAGGNERKTQAYFMEDESGTPYIMTIPGYHVYVSGILELDENGWRDKHVFGFNWRNFKELKASFPDPENDYIIKMEDRQVFIEGLMEVDTTRLNDFLDDVSLLTADEFIKADADSLLSQTPVVKLTVTDIGNRTYELSLYQPAADSKGMTGLINGGTPVRLGRSKGSRIIRPRGYFRAK